MKILFATGGTGGHINPALAAAGEIKKQFPDADILFVGTKEKMEARLVPAAGYAFETIEISGFQRKLTPENIKRNLGTVAKLFKSSSQAKKIIEKFKPDVVVGFGGYVSGPVLRMASKMGIPIAIHEQNAFPGKTNKILAKRADKVMLTVPEAEKYLESKNPCIVTGLPVRGEILSANRDEARFRMNLDDDKPLVLSMGGSLGAKAINEAVAGMIAKRISKRDCKYLHAMGQYGLWMPDALRVLGVDCDKDPDVEIREYINDMDVCLAAADLVICRAGASSLSELEALGKPAILIPSPNVAENHQYHNAMALVNKGAAVIIEEKDLTPDSLSQKVDELLANREALKDIGERAKALSIADANERICEVITSLVKK